MKLKWRKNDDGSRAIISLKCSCGTYFKKSMYIEDIVKQQIYIPREITEVAHNRTFLIDLNHCPKCAKKVVFEEQINVPMESYKKLKELEKKHYGDSRKKQNRLTI